MRAQEELNGNGAVTVGDYRRVVGEKWELQAEIDRLRHRLAAAEERLGELPTKAQLREIVDENEQLRKMNEILLRRNEVLNRKQKEQRP